MAPDLLLGAVLVITGMGIGRFWPARRKAPKQPAPVCGCGCNLCQHEPDGDGGGTACHGLIRRDSYNVHGDWAGDTWEPCGCRQYTGPRLLDPGYVARELTDGTR